MPAWAGTHGQGNTLHAFSNPAANDPELGAVYDARAAWRSRQSLLNFPDELSEG